MRLNTSWLQMLVDDTQQILAVTALLQRLGQHHQLVGVDEPRAPGNFFHARHFQSLPLLILKFLNALEQIEADLWIQYNELGGIQDNEVPGVNGGNPLYTAAITILDGDMAQYIHDNTDDEISHAAFLKAYLESKGAEAVDLSPFATIPGSTATGSTGKTRLTNLMKLTVDTSFWSRYRSITNPDFDPGAKFAQAVPSLNLGQHTAIPRTDADTAGSSLSNDNTKSITSHLQAIAFTAGFHFAFIEQGGSSLYPTLAQQVTTWKFYGSFLALVRARPCTFKLGRTRQAMRFH